MVFAAQTLRLVNEFFHVGSQLFSLGKGSEDAFVHDQLSTHRFHQTLSVLRVATELAEIVLVPHLPGCN